MSKAFRFVLQPLLEQYERAERDARIVLTMAQRSLHEAKGEAERLRQELKVHEGGVVQPQHRGNCALLYERVEHLHWQIRQQRKTVSSHEGEVNATRLMFVAATRKRKTLEQLKIRRANTHTLRAQLLEERHIDESNVRVRNVAEPGH